jgi:hypothetical protein
MKHTEINISGNMKAVEWLKAELLSELSLLYQAMADSQESSSYAKVEDTISSIITMSYILARRLGMSYSSIDERIHALAMHASANGHDLETEFSDMSALARHIKRRG